MTGNDLSYRRAIEALRAGVPNRDAVRVLGCSQPHIQERFERQLEESKVLAAQGKQVPGLVISGGFGTGKSHLLEHLHHLALEHNFVSSKIVISKETPLYDPTKLYRAAIDAAVVPDKQGSALREIAETMEDRPGYAEFYRRVTSDTSEFAAYFGASLVVHRNTSSAETEVRDRMISFWSGQKLGVSELRKFLKQTGGNLDFPYSVVHIVQKDLASQRLRFAAQLMRAAGYSGWLLLFDEVELISRYSWLQRARSYAEFARWAGAVEGEATPGLVAVFAATDILAYIGKDDQVPERLLARTSDSDRVLAIRAEEGMHRIRDAVPLTPPDRARIDEVGEKLRQVHARAYGWSPSPALFHEPVLTTTRMRTCVRSWINRWDLERLFPDYAPDIEAMEIEPTLAEDGDLEHAGEPGEDRD